MTSQHNKKTENTKTPVIPASGNISPLNAQRTLKRFGVGEEKIVSWFDFCKEFISLADEQSATENATTTDKKEQIDHDRFMAIFIESLAVELQLSVIPVFGKKGSNTLCGREKAVLDFIDRSGDGNRIFFKASDILNMALVNTGCYTRYQKSDFKKLVRLACEALQNCNDYSPSFYSGQMAVISAADERVDIGSDKKLPPDYSVG